MLKIYISVKQAGKRKATITKQELILDPMPSSLRELIAKIVRVQVDAYNTRVNDPRLLQYLLPEEMEAQLEAGKIGFGVLHNEQQADTDTDKAIATAILAFEDGLFRVFADDNEITELDAPVTLTEGTVLTLIRFTMLAGRVW